MRQEKACNGHIRGIRVSKDLQLLHRLVEGLGMIECLSPELGKLRLVFLSRYARISDGGFESF